MLCFLQGMNGERDPISGEGEVISQAGLVYTFITTWTAEAGVVSRAVALLPPRVRITAELC